MMTQVVGTGQILQRWKRGARDELCCHSCGSMCILTVFISKTRFPRLSSVHKIVSDDELE